MKHKGTKAQRKKEEGKLLTITNYQLPITNYQLPITNYRLPITDYKKIKCFFGSSDFSFYSG